MSAPFLAGRRDNPLAGVARLIERIEAIFLSCSFLPPLDNKSFSLKKVLRGFDCKQGACGGEMMTF